MKIQVISPDAGRDNKGHDFWVLKVTGEAVTSFGHIVLSPFSEEMPDIQLTFVGMPPKCDIPRRGRYKAAWLYARPEKDFADQNLDEFDQIYTLSTMHQQVFKEKTNRDTKVLLVATNKHYKPATEDYRYDIVYMATGVRYRADAMKTLAKAGYKIAIVGSKWAKEGAFMPYEKIKTKKVRANLQLMPYPNVDILTDFWPNDQFSEFFNMGPLTVYPLLKPYIQNGIIPIRILDIYASSDCLCLARESAGLEEVFSERPPTYYAEEELVELVKFYLDNPDIRRAKQKDVRLSLTRRYEDLVNDVIKDAKVFWEKK